MNAKSPQVSKQTEKQNRFLYLTVLVVFVFSVISSCQNQSSSSTETKDTTAAATPEAGGSMPALDTVTAIVGRIATISTGLEVVLDQRQPFFKLLSSNKKYAAISAGLKASFDKQTSIKLVIKNAGLTIEDMLPLSAAELEELAAAAKGFLKAPTSPILNKPGASIDAALKAMSKNVGCVSPISRTVLDSLYNICAAQACPGGADPCIPFQYVVDGCYARAHKMAAILSNTRYCYSKIWSFANQGTDRLALHARVGGCCIDWWYHVAIIVVVREASGADVTYVIDPGMFGGAVTSNAWLAAQQDATCVATARWTSFLVTTPEYYQPQNQAGTIFNTDNAFINTNATLRYYRNGVSCP